MKKVLAASINKLLLFDTADEFEEYISRLKGRKRAYAILARQELEGKLRVLIKEQYNANDLL